MYAWVVRNTRRLLAESSGIDLVTKLSTTETSFSAAGSSPDVGGRPEKERLAELRSTGEIWPASCTTDHERDVLEAYDRGWRELSSMQ